jgi:hypothetical protein
LRWHELGSDIRSGAHFAIAAASVSGDSFLQSGPSVRQRWINFQAEALGRMPRSMRTSLSVARHLPSYLGWTLHPQGRKRLAEHVGALRGRYAGRRCIVIGNGPSLNDIDLEPLKGEYTFGLNRIYLLTERLGFHVTFYVAIARYVLEQFTDDIRAVPGLKFLNWSYRRPFLDTPDAVFVETAPRLTPDGNILRGYYAGAGTVTNFALQIAYFLGFSEVILIGVDHRYQQSGTPNRAVIEQQADRNHFAPDYFGPGVIWQLPDLEAMEDGYRRVKALFERDSRLVVDATRGGMLTVFPKVEFQSHLRDSRWLSLRDDESV